MGERIGHGVHPCVVGCSDKFVARRPSLHGEDIGECGVGGTDLVDVARVVAGASKRDVSLVSVCVVLLEIGVLEVFGSNVGVSLRQACLAATGIVGVLRLDFSILHIDAHRASCRHADLSANRLLSLDDGDHRVGGFGSIVFEERRLRTIGIQHRHYVVVLHEHFQRLCHSVVDLSDEVSG